nr:hypothetical protein [Glycomyces albidus]
MRGTDTDHQIRRLGPRLTPVLDELHPPVQPLLDRGGAAPLDQLAIRIDPDRRRTGHGRRHPAQQLTQTATDVDDRRRTRRREIGHQPVHPPRGGGGVEHTMAETLRPLKICHRRTVAATPQPRKRIHSTP